MSKYLKNIDMTIWTFMILSFSYIMNPVLASDSNALGKAFQSALIQNDQYQKSNNEKFEQIRSQNDVVNNKKESKVDSVSPGSDVISRSEIQDLQSQRGPGAVTYAQKNKAKGNNEASNLVQGEENQNSDAELNASYKQSSRLDDVIKYHIDAGE